MVAVLATGRFAPGGSLSYPSEVIAALETVPGWSRKDTRIVGLLGGLSNQSYKVRHRGEFFALRLPAPHSAAAPGSQSTEVAIQEAAAAAGIAPPIIFADGKILVTRFVEAPAASRDEFDDPRFVDDLAALLRQVHNLPFRGRAFDATGAARRYREALPAGMAVADCCVRIIEKTEASSDGCCCHNDVVAENLLLSEGLTLIDWEFAAANDRYFDLACPIAYHDLGKAEADALLSAYEGGAKPEQREQLATMMRLFDALHWLWLARRQVLSPNATLADRLDRLTERIEGY